MTLSGSTARAQALRSRARKLGPGLAAGLLLVLVLALFAGGQARAASGVIASDSFSRTVSGGWGRADVGGAWTVLDSAASWSVSPGTGSVGAAATAQRRAVLSGVSVQDVDLLAKVTLPRCTGTGHYCDAFLLGRVSAGSDPDLLPGGIVQGPGSSDILLRTQRSDGTNLGAISIRVFPLLTGRRSCCGSSPRGSIRPRSVRALGGRRGASPRPGCSTSPTAPVRSRLPARSGCECQRGHSTGPHLRRSRATKRRPFPFPRHRAPSISGFTPSSGPVGTSVTISGSHFSGASAVSFGGTSTSGFVVNSDSQISATVPAGASSGPISVTTPNGTGTSAASFTVSIPHAPSISGFTPSSGPVGTSVTISGSYFSGASAVSFRGDEYVRVRGQLGQPDLSDRACGGEQWSDLGHDPERHGDQRGELHGQPPHAPSISGFTPSGGPVGTSVTISGSYFTRRERGVFRGYQYVRVRGQLGQPDLSDRACGGEQRSDLGHDPERHGDQRGQLHGHHRQRAGGVGQFRPDGVGWLGSRGCGRGVDGAR